MAFPGQKGGGHANAKTHVCSPLEGHEPRTIQQGGGNIPVDGLIEHRFAKARWNGFPQGLSVAPASGSNTCWWPDAVSRFPGGHPNSPSDGHFKIPQ
jgi:hypothetical protein